MKTADPIGDRPLFRFNDKFRRKDMAENSAGRIFPMKPA